MKNVWQTSCLVVIFLLAANIVFIPFSSASGKAGTAQASVTTTTWYLAEGSTSGFSTWVLVQNPNSSDADVTFTYMDGDGNTVQESTTVSANRRYTRNVNAVDGMSDKSGVSTKVESTNSVGIIAERSMYWDAGGVSWAGGHCAVGVTSPANTWYLAEGSTSGFSTWVLVQNPNSSDASITFTYMDGDGNTVQESTTVSANRRYTRNINAVSGMEDKSGVSTKVESTNSVGVIAERAMYWDAGGVSWAAGHCSAGVKNPSTTWYLAEGSTSSFSTWVLVQNPNSSDAGVTFTYMDSDGNTVQESTTVLANRRYSRNVNVVEGMNDKSGVSTKVESTNGVAVIAERAMYWDANGVSWAGGHCTVGVTSPAATWYLAEGSTSGFSTWVLVQNPSSSDASVTFTYMDTDGNTVQESTTVSANRRYSRNINAVSGMNDKSGVSTKVESTNSIGIIAERAMYWDAGGISWYGGHCVAGATSDLPFADMSMFGFGGGSINDKNLAEYSGAGAGWLRPHLGYCIWGYIQEEAQSSFDFDEFDNMVLENQAEGLNILITIWPYANWDQLNRADAANYRVPDDDQFVDAMPRYRGNPVDWDAYETWLTAVVERYDGDGEDDMSGLLYPIRYWEVVNEPDINYSGDEDLNFHMGEPEDYADLLKRSYVIIMAADPQAQVLIAAAAGNRADYLNYFRSVLNVSGAASSFHIANIHCISSGSTEDFNVADYKDMLAEYSLSSLPIWVTEAENVTGDDLTENIALLEQSVAGSLSAGAVKIFFTANALSEETNGLPGETYIYTNIVNEYE